MPSRDYVVLGGGLAGLTIAREIARAGHSVAVVEQAPIVGGLARTVRVEGFSFDLGGHRFHSNNPDVVGWLHDLLGGDLLRVERRSRIHLNGRFIDYPIRLAQATTAFGMRRGASIGVSYLAAAALADRAKAVTFEDWVVSRFGRGLFDLYFRPYTEKVWGVPCERLSADWAAQRIGLPSLTQALLSSLRPGRVPPATIVREFHYPRRGYGVISERLAEAIVGPERDVMTGTSVEALRFGHDSASVSVRTSDGARTSIDCARVISTVPVRSLLTALSEDPESARLASQTTLAYRGLLLVFLALDRPRVTDDTWTYFPAPTTLFGRCHEPRNWSVAMVPNEGVTSLALEVFCSPGEEAWSTADRTLIDVAVRQLEELGWIRSGEVLGGWVQREPHAYPVYLLDYRAQLESIRGALQRWPRLSLLGRTGSFQYLNADGIVEAAFALARQLGIGADRVRPLTEPAGRWV
jgi:protoporphyrinogen oxidase